MECESNRYSNRKQGKTITPILDDIITKCY